MTTGHEIAGIHSAAPAHLPAFITIPGSSDWLMSVVAVFLLMMIIGIGVFYLKLHHLPDHLAHRGQKVQYEIVAVLCLIALFTHNHLFWIAALLLAFIPMPDFSTPLSSMANSLGRMAGIEPAPPSAEPDQPAAAQNARNRSGDPTGG